MPASKLETPPLYPETELPRPKPAGSTHLNNKNVGEFYWLDPFENSEQPIARPIRTASPLNGFFDPQESFTARN
jgi:hypothetical protein